MESAPLRGQVLQTVVQAARVALRFAMDLGTDPVEIRPGIIALTYRVLELDLEVGNRGPQVVTPLRGRLGESRVSEVGFVPYSGPFLFRLHLPVEFLRHVLELAYHVLEVIDLAAL